VYLWIYKGSKLLVVQEILPEVDKACQLLSNGRSVHLCGENEHFHRLNHEQSVSDFLFGKKMKKSLKKWSSLCNSYIVGGINYFLSSDLELTSSGLWPFFILPFHN
jgi:hypothetical protein